MSITDELRGWLARELASWKMARERYDEIIAIADRIDAEHERAVRYERCGFWHDASDDELANYGLLRAPIDADGVPIRVGDVMEWVRYGDDDPTIVRTVIGVGFEVFFAWSDEQGRYAQYEAHAYRHHHAPTVEDVMVEFATGWESAQDGEDKTAVLKKYAKRLTLAEGEDA